MNYLYTIKIMGLAKETMTVLEAKNVVMFKLLSTVLNLDADFPELIITSNDITLYLLHILNYMLSSYLVNVNNGSYWMIVEIICPKDELS